VRLKAQLIRELDRLEVLLKQLKTVEAERDALLKPATDEATSAAAISRAAVARDLSRWLIGKGRLSTVGWPACTGETNKAMTKTAENPDA